MVEGEQSATAIAGDAAARQHWMSVLAKADGGELHALWDKLTPKPKWQCLRPPEIGMVMVQGRAGGTGGRFNLGEMTVTRCAVRLVSGGTGFGYVAGRDRQHAERAAVIDALLQDPDHHDAVAGHFIAPLRSRHRDAAHQAGRKAAATKVEFFTLVRGD